ncbi:hypothetical protein D037_4367B, partial [Vibrio parahaemolyticus IDH02640]
VNQIRCHGRRLS